MEIVLELLLFVLIDVVFVWTAISLTLPLAVYRVPKFIGIFAVLVAAALVTLISTDSLAVLLGCVLVFNVIASAMHVVYLRGNHSG